MEQYQKNSGNLYDKTYALTIYIQPFVGTDTFQSLNLYHLDNLIVSNGNIVYDSIPAETYLLE
jgi:hypothetical protein